MVLKNQSDSTSVGGSVQKLEVVATLSDLYDAQEAGQLRPLALVYHDRFTGPTGEYLVLLYRAGNQWTMYHGSSALMQRSKLRLNGEWLGNEEVDMKVTDPIDSIDESEVDRFVFNPPGTTLNLDIPGIDEVEWQRVDPTDYELQLSDDEGTMKLTGR